jgi:signal transduction histidine kinase
MIVPGKEKMLDRKFNEAPLLCPQCGQLVDNQDRECPSCGVNLAMAAGLAAQALTTGFNFHPSLPVAPEILVPRLGEILLERGVLSPKQLQAALDYSNELRAEGKPCLFGRLLMEMGLVNQDTLDKVVTEQILQLQQALHASNQQLEQRVKERTSDLQNALTKLSELSEMKSNFISNISHELRTPLTHIKGYLNLLADSTLGPLTEDQTTALDVLQRSEMRLEQLIEDLIQFSLVSRGELSLNLKPTSVNDLVSTTINRTSKLAKARSVQMKVNLAKNLPLVRADGEKISWVLLQLQDNAIKFTPQGGTVTMDAYFDGGLVTLAVTDTGIGIAPNRLDEIFEPFHQLDGSDTRPYGGTGLGLALVKKIVDAHGAIMKVHSQIGKGSRFEFTLPPIRPDDIG